MTGLDFLILREKDVLVICLGIINHFLVISVTVLAIILNYGLIQALHHPFIAPNPEDMNDLASARALAYDMVYNGVEVRIISDYFPFVSCEAGDLITDICINNNINLSLFFVRLMGEV